VNIKGTKHLVDSGSSWGFPMLQSFTTVKPLLRRRDMCWLSRQAQRPDLSQGSAREPAARYPHAASVPVSPACWLLAAQGLCGAAPPRAVAALLMPLWNLLQLCQERSKSFCWPGCLCPQGLCWLGRGRVYKWPKAWTSGGKPVF